MKSLFVIVLLMLSNVSFGQTQETEQDYSNDTLLPCFPIRTYPVYGDTVFICNSFLIGFDRHYCSVEFKDTINFAENLLKAVNIIKSLKLNVLHFYFYLPFHCKTSYNNVRPVVNIAFMDRDNILYFDNFVANRFDKIKIIKRFGSFYFKKNDKVFFDSLVWRKFVYP